MEKEQQPINNFIVWHKGDCNIFKGETDAMNFIRAAQRKDPHVFFNGWVESGRGNNMVAVISEYDEVYQHEKAAAYLMARLQ